MIEEFAGLIPEALLEVSGKAFYSGRDAFGGAADLYIIGLNPGRGETRNFIRRERCRRIPGKCMTIRRITGALTPTNRGARMGRPLLKGNTGCKRMCCIC